jgi:peptidoglycan/LPS O-acetylase OafA/YrhL
LFPVENWTHYSLVTDSKTANSQTDGKLIAPLTGLRFVAAATVAIGHAAPSLRHDWVGQLIAQVSSIGMTLFFVLSGFVLWLTYAERLLRAPKATLRDFAVARFARLYPMYAVVVLAITGYLVIWRNQDLAPLGFVLTMTQAWFPEIGGTMLVAAIQPLEHLWSISVELFFYLLFPLACLSLGGIHRARSIVLAAALNVVVFAILTAAFFLKGDAFLHATVPSLTHDGMAWLTYYSPYLHISQFLAGCLTAQLYLKLAAVQVDDAERRLIMPAFWLSVSGLLAAPALLFFQPDWHAASFWIEIAVRLDQIVSFSILILAVARLDRLRFLGSKAAVTGGECSYSIYLLHPFLFRFALIGKSEFPGLPEFFARLFFFVAIATAVAWVFYRLVEVPSKSWLRNAFRSGSPRGVAAADRSIASAK